jgi:hypothetical protein
MAERDIELPGPQTVAPPKIIYLDQNKWIELARAVKYPSEKPEVRAVLELLCQEVEAGRVLLPLSSTNIYETHKINVPQRRFSLAETQATLSKGIVFRGRHKRLEVEIINVLRNVHGLPLFERGSRWFLSDIFFEAFLEMGDPRLEMTFSKKLIDLIRSAPSGMLFDYLTTATDDVRKFAVAQFSDGSEQLRQRIEERRARHANESISVRRDIHNVLMMHSEIDLILAVAAKAGVTNRSADDLVRENARAIMNDSPTYLIEREIALRIEAQKTRKITENDFRDMQAFCAVVAYADVIIGENMFSNLAKQSQPDKKFDTQIITSILDLKDHL